VGSGKPSSDIVVRGNYLCKAPMQIGYSAPTNVNCEILENVLLDCGINVRRYDKVKAAGNLIINGALAFEKCKEAEQDNNQTIKKDQAPEQPKAALLPNKYDSDRANVVVLNPRGAKEVQVPVGGFLKPGDKYRLMLPDDLYGTPAHQGTCAGDTLAVPLDGEFAVFVAFKM